MRSFIFAAFAAAVTAHNIDLEFIVHVSQYGLSYGTIEEFNFRKAIFATAHNFVEDINS